MRRALRRPLHQVVHRVVIDERAVAAAARAVALGEHAQHFVELGALQIAVGVGAAQQREQLVLVPLARGHFGDDLLRQHVERLRRHDAAGRAPRGARPRAARRIRRGHRATAGTAGPWACRRPSGRSARRAAGRRRSSAARRSGTRGRPRRCRCRARATRWPPAPAARPPFRRCSASRRDSFARLPWCAVTCSSPRRSERWRARRSAWRRVLTNTSVVRCSRDQLPRDGRRSASTPRRTSPPRAARRASRAAGRARARGRRR